MLTRRLFLQSGAAFAAAGKPKQVAIVADSYRALSPAQVLGDHLLAGYPHDGEWLRPNLKVAAMFVARRGEGDLSAERAREFGIAAAASVAEAVKGADGVLVAGSGLLEECVQKMKPGAVFQYGPVAESFDRAKEIAALARRRGIALSAGTATPFAYRLPDTKLDGPAREALVAAYGEGQEFEALDVLQSLVEREVQKARWVEGAEVWTSGAYSKDLLAAALSRSDTPLGLTVEDGRTQNLMAPGLLQSLVAKPKLCAIEYRDGTKASLLMLSGAIRDFTFAVRTSGIRSGQFLRGPEPALSHYSLLVHKIVQMFETGRPARGVEGPLMAGGILQGAFA